MQPNDKQVRELFLSPRNKLPEINDRTHSSYMPSFLVIPALSGFIKALTEFRRQSYLARKAQSCISEVSNSILHNFHKTDWKDYSLNLHFSEQIDWHMDHTYKYTLRHFLIQV